MQNFTEKDLGNIFFILSILILSVNLIVSVNENTLRYDEIFTLTLIKDNVHDIIRLTMEDVHPPLHYLIVKGFFSFFNMWDLGNIIPGKISSSIPTILLLLFSFRYLKDDIGYLGSGLFSLSIVMMPQFLFYLTDIRMYSWSMLLCTMFFYYGYRITKRGSWKNYTVFVFIGALAAYTHYFCLIFIASIYLMMILYYSLRNNINEIKILFISILVLLILYTPWLFIIFRQINGFSNIWINNFDQQMALNFFMYLMNSNIIAETSWDLKSQSNVSWMTITILSLLLILTIYSLKFAFKEKLGMNMVISKLSNENFLFFGFIIIILESTIALVLSNLIGFPLLHVRYVFIAFACFWLTVSILMSRVYHANKRLFACCLILFLAGGLMSDVTGLNAKYNNKYYANDLKNSLYNIENDDLVISSDLSATGLMNLYINHSDNNTLTMSLDSYWEIPFKKIYFNSHRVSNKLNNDEYNIADKINKTLNKGHKVFYLSGMDNEKDISKLIDLINDIDMKKIHDYNFYIPRSSDNLDYMIDFIVEIKK